MSDIRKKELEIVKQSFPVIATLFSKTDKIFQSKIDDFRNDVFSRLTIMETRVSKASDQAYKALDKIEKKIDFDKLSKLEKHLRGQLDNLKNQDKTVNTIRSEFEMIKTNYLVLTKVLEKLTNEWLGFMSCEIVRNIQVLGVLVEPHMLESMIQQIREAVEEKYLGPLELEFKKMKEVAYKKVRKR